MLKNRFGVWAAMFCLILATLGTPVTAQEDVDQDLLQSWRNFIHFIRIARMDAAVANGRAFADADASAEQILAVIEASEYADNYEPDLIRAQKAGGELAEVASTVADIIEEAQLEFARDNARIEQAVQRLDRGLRARQNAMTFLFESGEYAAPVLLEIVTGRTDRDEALKPYALQALTDLGRPVVVPICEAMPYYAPVTQQSLARVLANIGYPVALPYMKALIESPDTEPGTRDVLKQSFQRIAGNRGISMSQSASELFLALAEDYYAQRDSLIMAPTEEQNLVWDYDPENNMLNAANVPTEIFFDVMAMRNSKQSVELNEEQTEALSLWVAANFRRENNLPPGDSDSTYGPEMRSPFYYGVLSGPQHLSPVLSRALEGGDPDLALDAIRALQATGSVEQLTSSSPLLVALNDNDRRVRFEAAFAIAQARPGATFPQSDRVVPTLADAVRDHSKVLTLSLASEMDQANSVAGALDNYPDVSSVPASNIAEAEQQRQAMQGLDVIVVSGSVESIQNQVAAVRDSPYLQLTAVLVLTNPGDEMIALRGWFRNDPLTMISAAGVEGDAFGEAVRQAAQLRSGKALSDRQAQDYAVEALQMLTMLLDAKTGVFDPSESLPTLIAAVDDPRPEVAEGAGQVLARFDDQRAQQAIATVALEEETPRRVRVSLFESLAFSARNHGVMLSDQQIDDLLDAVQTLRDELADAAAQAYGAMNLPTQMGQQAILQ